MSLFDNSVLINLDKRVDRLERFDAQAKQLNINYHRLSAIEDADPIKGCRLSHIAALQHFDSEIVFVFEDDACFVDNFYEELDKSLEMLPDDWDMAYLGANLVITHPVNNRWHKSQVCSSTHAYAVRRKAVDKLIEQAQQYDGHVDVAYSLLHPKLNVYLARPTLVYQGESFSDIKQESVDYRNLYF